VAIRAIPNFPLGRRDRLSEPLREARRFIALGAFSFPGESGGLVNEPKFRLCRGLELVEKRSETRLILLGVLVRQEVDSLRPKPMGD
jgi:hypothetical protein